jgi:hypothetical protein
MYAIDTVSEPLASRLLRLQMKVQTAVITSAVIAVIVLSGLPWPPRTLPGHAQ